MSARIPDISILMAAKNVGPYLRVCLDSILSQTFENWELVVVNDHSDDDTQSILDEYAAKDARIQPFMSEGHRLNPALKTGYKHLRAPLVNRMDADDKMPVYKLQVMFDAYEGEGSIVAGGTQHFIDNGEVGDGFLRYDQWLNDVAKRGSHYKEIYRECVFPSHCWLIHRNDLDKIDAFQNDIYPEDYDLAFRFYQLKLKVIPIDRILHYWRDTENRISRTWDEYKDNRYFDIKLRYFYAIDRDDSRPLVLWGAGKNGKDLAQLILQRESNIHWVCNNERKIGKDIYGVVLNDEQSIKQLINPQIIVVVSNPQEREEIRIELSHQGREEGSDFWFFL